MTAESKAAGSPASASLPPDRRYRSTQALSNAVCSTWH